MPVYHSSFNDAAGDTPGGMLVLPLKTGPHGPAAISPADYGTKMDMVDEAIYYFRANVLFSSFEFKGPADKVHVYLTVFVQQCLVRACADPSKTRSEIESALTLLAGANPPIPGEAGFLLPGAYFSAVPVTEQERLRQYLKQLRQATVTRFTPHIFNADGKVSKWWSQFSKRKFMGIATA